MRLTSNLFSGLVACALLGATASNARAEYINLRSGQRFHVTSYERLGDKYRLQIAGGMVEVSIADVVRIDPEEAFVSVPQPTPTAPYQELVKAAAKRYAVDEELISSVIAAESNFDPKAVSKRNARGLMQLLPETAAQYGVQNIFDPQENIDAGTHYLSELLQRYNNDLALALAAYNAGPEKVTQFGSVPPYRETVSYVRRVKQVYLKSKSGDRSALALKGSTVKSGATDSSFSAAAAAAFSNSPAASTAPQPPAPKLTRETQQ